MSLFKGLAAVLCFLSMAAKADKSLLSDMQVVGEAYQLNGEQLLYRELHSYGADGQRHQVEYRDVDGRLIAKKILNYGRGAATPEFTQWDYRNDRETSVYWADNGFVLSRIQDQQRLFKQFEPRSPLVLDAGFDAFIRSHWSELTTGQVMTFHFPLLKNARLVELRVRRSECSYSALDQQCFKLQLSNRLLRLLTEPIELGYDPKRKLLLRYRGLSNIEDEKGKGLPVDIRYRYKGKEAGNS